MKNGWIKIHRKLKEKGYYNRPQYLALWIHLLLSANHEEKEFMWNGNIILVKEGQMITGRQQLSTETGIPESTIEDILKFLERQHQIQQQKTTKYRLITIVNWTKHQVSDSKSNNKPTTSQQQADTNKNVKNDKKEKKLTSEDKSSPKINDLVELFEPLNPITYKKWFSNKTQRAAIGRLSKLLGGKLGLAIETAAKANEKPYAPTITTPLQLEEKLSALRAFVAKEQGKSKWHILS